MMTFNPWLRALCSLLLLSGAAGCKVEFPNDVPYTCGADADCGGDGYVCTALPNDGPKYCCLPEPDELCNSVDDDCDGAIDELDASCYTGPEGTSGVGTCRPGQSACTRTGGITCVNQVLPINEECNGQDDDCDGRVDEDFDLQTDPGYCGRCDVSCTFLQNCVNGECVRRGELNCGDGNDDEGDGPADCQDREDCENQSCGTGCVCRNGRKAETACGHGSGDEDDDGLLNCADRDDCDNQPCGEGCACISGTAKETLCDRDSGDEDGDGLFNCADPDCNRQVCGEGLICQNSGPRTGCVEGVCDNGVNDDGVGGTDCADPVCAGETCGMGCTCASSTRTEVDCTDRISNDGDADIDCADSDCNLKACTPGQSDAFAWCDASTCTEVNCRDTRDNDGDEKPDCADDDCLGKQCTRANGSTGRCQSGGLCN
ncbi:hypothetical protein [Myxococcus sp. RHSTA-1-4]|uniref:hypothetical protein n=1 Tax=Myxococcus sp. RHSTA-1-4 TaxID=2874601 RepID=UPI001CBB46D9|nr:hypothetical protein [Myxococcus sp. RHSTA-1-4]MBZ4415483.1 hypothetical protein [Myxococcus sp. RHSTA-1-4]